jgi:hypothetical protein
MSPTSTPNPTSTAREPAWAEELRERYLRGEASLFVLHGNVNDLVLHEGQLLGVQDYLCRVLLPQTKQTVLRFDVASGVEVLKSKVKTGPGTTGRKPDAYLDDLLLQRDPTKLLPALERLLVTSDEVAVVIDYAEMLAPNGDINFFSESDRQCVTTFQRWSMLPQLQKSDNLVILVTENLAELNQKIVSNPKTAIVRLEMPDEGERRELIQKLLPGVEATWLERLVEITAALRNVQIQAVLQPNDNAAQSPEQREALIASMLGDGPGSAERAKKFAAITHGMGPEEIRSLVAPQAQTAPSELQARERVVDVIFKRKREIIERECFGLIEFVESSHDFSVVGGMDEIKADLTAIAKNVREGQRERVPMGLLFTGPMGTGKTFVAEAFIKETGLTGIQFKNFRSKWVGATESNLGRILNVIQAMGQVVVVIDEGDRAFGNAEGESDGGTGSRVIARLKEFMSNTDNRGRVLFVLMTNRPDKLDVDLKRAGRLDRKIPFLYPQEPADVESVLMAQLRKHKLKSELVFPRDRAASEPLVGYSNAEIEGVVLLAGELAGQGPITSAAMASAIHDYLPSRDQDMLEYMELVAVFEASNRKYLPKKYAQLSASELQDRLAQLRLRVGNRR